jgi:hypothetical protein
MKSHLRWSKASGTTKRLVARLLRQGPRACRRSVSSKRRDLVVQKWGEYEQ